MRIFPKVFELINGELVEFGGDRRQLTHHMSTKAVVHREDGSQTEIEVEEYPVKYWLDPMQVNHLVQQGTWTDEDLEPFGLVMSDDMDIEPDEGKRFTSEITATYDPATKRVILNVKQEDIPPPPPEPTREEKLARLMGDYGLTTEDVKAMVSDAPAEPVAEPQ